MAIVLTNFAETAQTEIDSLTVDPFGFDDITRGVILAGNGPGILSKFPLGSAHPVLKDMYCTGPQSARTLPGGYCEATIAWKGFATSSRATSTTYSISTRETTGPIYSVNIANETNYSYAGDPFTPGIINPKTGTYYRFRLIERVKGISQQGVTIGTPGTPPVLPDPPKITAPGFLNAQGIGIDWTKLMDPLYTYPYGWVLRDYQVNSQFSVGGIALFFWTARWENIDRIGP